MNGLRRLALMGLLGYGMSLPVPRSQESLDEAKRLYNEGRFGQAVARLQSLLLKLEGDPTPEARALREEAYLYFGLAYVALDDPEAARAAFRALARISPGRHLDARVYAPKVLEAFEAARQELADAVPGEAVETAPSPVGVTSSAPPSSQAAARGGESKGSSRAKWTLVGAGVGGGAAAAATTLTRSTTTTTTTAPPATVEIDLRVNGLKRGTFSCSQEMAFTVDVINGTSQIVRVQGFDINLMSLTAQCVTHRAILDGTVNLDLLPGARVQVRRVDLGGEVCLGPGRVAGCDWRALIVVMTSVGNFQDEAQLSTVP